MNLVAGVGAAAAAASAACSRRSFGGGCAETGSAALRSKTDLAGQGRGSFPDADKMETYSDSRLVTSPEGRMSKNKIDFSFHRDKSLSLTSLK